MAKLTGGPVSVRAASLALTGSLANVVGTVSTDNANGTSGAISVGSLVVGRLQCAYTRHASSTTGRPRFALDVSMDPVSTTPASVARWVPTYLLDGSSFSAGVIDAYAEVVGPAPSVTGESSIGTPPFDLRGANWLRVRAVDVDGSNPGAISGLVLGGEA